MMRILGLLFGIPILLIGIMWIAGSLGKGIPPMGICGALFVWLGYRLVSTKPVKPSMPKIKRSKVSN
jgi:hypothetical protein